MAFTLYTFCMSTGWAKLYGGCAEIVQKSCNADAVAVQSLQIPHGNRTAPVRASTDAGRKWCGDCVRAVRSPYDFIVGPNDHLKSCDFRKISAWPPHDAPTTCLRATGVRFFQICQKSSLTKS